MLKIMNITVALACVGLSSFAGAVPPKPVKAKQHVTSSALLKSSQKSVSNGDRNVEQSQETCAVNPVLRREDVSKALNCARSNDESRQGDDWEKFEKNILPTLSLEKLKVIEHDLTRQTSLNPKKTTKAYDVVSKVIKERCGQKSTSRPNTTVPRVKAKTNFTSQPEITREQDLKNYESCLRKMQLDALEKLVEIAVASKHELDVEKIELAQKVLIERGSCVDFLKNQIWPQLSVEALRKLRVHLLEHPTVWNRADEKKKMDALSQLIHAKSDQNNTRIANMEAHDVVSQVIKQRCGQKNTSSAEINSDDWSKAFEIQAKSRSLGKLQQERKALDQRAEKTPSALTISQIKILDRLIAEKKKSQPVQQGQKQGDYSSVSSASLGSSAHASAKPARWFTKTRMGIAFGSACAIAGYLWYRWS